MMEDITRWLESLGLGRYAPTFAAAEIDSEILADITDADLEKLGIPLGPRKKLLKAVASLDSAAVASPSLAPPIVLPRSEAERRHMTILFADMVGSTPLSQSLDPEDFHRVIRRFQDSARDAVTRYDGHVAKFMGDGVLAYFGWPKAHEDDAERAVRAGLGLVAAARVLPGALNVRVGIATGLVVVGEVIGEGSAREETAAGETLNLAARIQSVAQAGSVLLAPATRDLLARIFELKSLGTHELKGIAGTTELFSVVGERSSETRFEAVRANRLSPLLGRDNEIALATTWWDQAKSGDGQVALLRAEPGIGKSRLIAELRERIGPEATATLQCQCSPHHVGSALYPFIQQIARLTHIDAVEGPDAKTVRLEALLNRADITSPTALPLLAALLSIPLPESYAPLRLTPQQQKDDTLRLLTELYAGLSTRGPLLLIVEDMHWIDPTSRDLLDGLVSRLKNLPVLLLVSFRPEMTPPWSDLTHVSLLSLNRLSRLHTEQLIASLDGGKPLPKTVVEQIVQKSDGVAVFVEELTKAVIESGHLLDNGKRYELRGPLQLAVPSSLQASLNARLDRLAPAREVVQIGAALGREFDVELLAAVASFPRDQVNAALAELHRAELIFPGNALSRSTWTFKHALIQDAAYDTLLKASRLVLHGRIAQAIEVRFPELADAEPETLARHHEHSGDSVRSSTYWRKAGERSAGRYQGREAVHHFEKAISQILNQPQSASGGSTLLDLRLRLGDAQLKAGYQLEAIQTFSMTAVLARQASDNKAFVESALGRSMADFYSGQALDGAIDLLSEALEIIEADDNAVRLTLLNALSRSLSMSGQASRAAAVSQQAIELARRLGNDRALAQALEQSFFSSPAGFEPEQMVDHQQRLEELLRTTRQSGDIDSEGRVLALRAYWSAAFGDGDALDSNLASFRALADRYAIHHLQFVARQGCALQAILRGDFDLAERMAEEALESRQQSAGVSGDGVYGMQMFTIRREQGRLGEVAPVLKRFIDDQPDGAAWKPGFALIASDLGFEAPARRALDEMAANRFSLPDDAKRSATLSYLAEVAVRLRDMDRIRQLYDLLLPYRFMTITIGVSVVCYGAAARFLGRMANVLGSHSTAIDHFERALEINRGMRAWPWLAHTQADYGQALKELGRSQDEARWTELLEEATAAAARYKMTFLRDRLDGYAIR